MENKKPDETVDTRGDVCPIPDIKTQKALRKMKKGQIVEVLTDYPLSTERIPKTAQSQGHKILKVERIQGPDYRILIEVGGTS